MNLAWGEVYPEAGAVDPSKNHSFLDPPTRSTATTALGELLTKGTMYASVHGPHVPSNTSRYTSIDYGLIHYIGLDMQHFDATQKAWLQADLAAAAANRASVPWIIASSHYPIYHSALKLHVRGSAAMNPETRVHPTHHSTIRHRASLHTIKALGVPPFRTGQFIRSALLGRGGRGRDRISATAEAPATTQATRGRRLQLGRSATVHHHRRPRVCRMPVQRCGDRGEEKGRRRVGEGRGRGRGRGGTGREGGVEGASEVPAKCQHAHTPSMRCLRQPARGMPPAIGVASADAAGLLGNPPGMRCRRWHGCDR